VKVGSAPPLFESSLAATFSRMSTVLKGPAEEPPRLMIRKPTSYTHGVMEEDSRMGFHSCSVGVHWATVAKTPQALRYEWKCHCRVQCQCRSVEGQIMLSPVLCTAVSRHCGRLRFSIRSCGMDLSCTDVPTSSCGKFCARGVVVRRSARLRHLCSLLLSGGVGHRDRLRPWSWQQWGGFFLGCGSESQADSSARRV